MNTIWRWKWFTTTFKPPHGPTAIYRWQAQVEVEPDWDIGGG